MKTNTSVRWFLVGFSLLTFLSFVGVTTGTLAWYAYSTRADIAYKGVSINKTEQLQIGIVDYRDTARIKLSSEDLENENCYRDVDIVWAKPGSGLNQTIISAYLSNTSTDSFVSSLQPVTTQDRALNNTTVLSLYKSPVAGYSNTGISAANDSYVKIPFVFRVIDNDNNYVDGANIWLRRAEAKVISTDKHDITKSLRVFMQNPGDANYRYLVNPSSKDDGATTVAGLLDLDHNGYYDHGANDPYNANYELLYGSYQGTPTYGAETTEDSGFDDVNGTGFTGDEANTFYAKHKAQTHTINNLSDLELGKAHYYGMESMQPTLDTTTGGLVGGQPVTYTSDYYFKLAYLDVTIFLEGWDHCVIDKAINCQFNLGLTFEIDRV